jgi:hypothetical protein
VKIKSSNNSTVNIDTNEINQFENDFYIRNHELRSFNDFPYFENMDDDDLREEIINYSRENMRKSITI